MNEELVELPFETRLLFIGLWTLADREGRLEDRPKRITMELFPADSVDVDLMLTALHDAGMICRYEVSGRRYIEVSNFAKHQSPHYKEAESTIPPPAGKNPDTSSDDRAKASGSDPDDRGSNRSDSGFLIPDSLIPDSSAAVAALPSGLDPVAWDRWVEYRKKIRKPIKPVSMPAAQRKLAGFGADQAAVVENAIANGWQGVFPLKPGEGRPPGEPSRFSPTTTRTIRNLEDFIREG